MKSITRKKILREVFSRLWETGKKKKDFSLIVALLVVLWNTDYGSVLLEKTPTYLKLKVTTGGWRDNEELLFALENTPFWEKFWIGWERGGVYFFEVPWVWLETLTKKGGNS